MCNNSGEWEDIDFSSCTMRNGTTPLIMILIDEHLSNLNTSLVTNEVSIHMYYIIIMCSLIYVIILNVSDM